MKKVEIEESWHTILDKEFVKSYFLNIRSKLTKEYKEKKIHPHPSKIFNAFNKTPFDDVKVVILGQDPYHGPNQAHGLCFSVESGIKIPPSLKNIFKELQDDICIKTPKSGDLTRWAIQGVFLLNSVLTVETGKANSHKNIGWEEFTRNVIERLSERKSGIVFLLWGKQAQQKEVYIDTSKHLILKAAHPSPLSAYNGFFGCKHFSKANSYLEKYGKATIDWQIK